MSGDTAAGPHLVHAYLADLDAALADVPSRQARALRAQIITHLHDALAPGASDEDVEFVLAQLGPSAELAAEAGARHPELPRTPWRPHWPRVNWQILTPWRVIAMLAALVAAAAVASWFAVPELAPPLRYAGHSSWYFAQDAVVARAARADGHAQTTVPVRSGQWQGIAILIRNPSGRTQTVRGSADFVVVGGQNAKVGVAAAAAYPHESTNFRALRYLSPGNVPPHQQRWLRVLWRSDTCLQGKGFAQGQDTLDINVRVGWITRVETIRLGAGYFVTGPSLPRDSAGWCT